MLDALAEQVERLGEVPELDHHSRDRVEQQGGAQQDQRRPASSVSPGEASGGSSIYEQLWSLQGRAPE